jgi:hypothetical protein
MSNIELIISQTKKWITDVVIGCNFCPFAAKPVKEGTVRYAVVESAIPLNCLDTLLEECRQLDINRDIETTLLIMVNAVPLFEDYLQLLDRAEKLLRKNKYEGVYQLASFHPHYSFADAVYDDPANYTNRSVYPMFQLLREESVTQAVEKYPFPEKIPEKNIVYARSRGLKHMQILRDACVSLRQDG